MTDEELANAEPMEYYEEYCDYLMGQTDLLICNGDDLVRHFESSTYFEEFLEWRK